MANERNSPDLLKKRDLLKALRISRTTFEKKLADGIIPAPHTWVTENPHGRRWHPEDIRQCFGVTVEA